MSIQQGSLKGEKNFGGNTIKLEVPLVYFQEDGINYAYIPAFDLTGYGKTEEEALNSIGIILDEFLRYTLSKNTLLLELRRLGWKIRSKKKPMIAPVMSDLINTNEQLREIINHKQYTTSNYSVNVPSYA